MIMPGSLYFQVLLWLDRSSHQALMDVQREAVTLRQETFWLDGLSTFPLPLHAAWMGQSTTALLAIYR